jgi:hypothetical protein
LQRGGEVGQAAGVGEHALVSEVGEQAAAIGKSERAVHGDGFPDAIDVLLRDAALGEELGGEAGVLLEACVARSAAAESEVVENAGRREQVSSHSASSTLPSCSASSRA